MSHTQNDGQNPGFIAPSVPSHLKNDKKYVIHLRSKDGANYRSDKKRIVIGSVASADFRVIGSGVSALHAVIEINEVNGKTESTLFDLASDTGVYVNKKKCITQQINNADEITIGHRTFVFELTELGKTVEKTDQSRMKKTDEGRRTLFFNEKEEFAPLLLESDVENARSIFTYPAANTHAIEVVCSWNGTILDIRHFLNAPAIILGTHKNDHFLMPSKSFANKSRHTLLAKQGDSYVLQLVPEMSGVVCRKGQLIALCDIQDKQISFNVEDFAKISIAGLDFYLSFTSAPPLLKRFANFDRDPFLFKLMATSALLTTALVVALLNIRVPESIDAEQIPDRIATILYQPEKAPRPKVRAHAEKIEKKAEVVQEKETPVKPRLPKVVKLDIKPNEKNITKPVPKVLEMAQPKKAGPAFTKKQGQAKEGAGAKAKGAEGLRGSKHATAVAKVDPQKQAKRPSPQSGMGAGGGQSEVADLGNVESLKGLGAKFQDILSTTTAQLGKSGSKLKGYGGFDTRGNGGEALSGRGVGGGGTADSLGAGLAEKGRGGGRIGTGLGATGSGASLVGGKTRVVIRSGGPEEAVVMGSIDADAVEAALLAHKDEFRACYEREINAETPHLSGRVGTSFVIGSSGRVNQAGIESTSLKNAGVERCVITVIKRIQFPVPRGGGIVQVSYPFKFNKLK